MSALSTDFPGQPFGPGDTITFADDQHSVRVAPRPAMEPAELARLAREAATDIDRGHPVEGLRRLVAIGGLAKVLADRIEAGR